MPFPAPAWSALEVAGDAGLDVFTSASLDQGDLARAVPASIAARAPGETSAQRAINVVRSAPGVTSALVGASRREHVEENLAAGRHDRIDAESDENLFA